MSNSVFGEGEQPIQEMEDHSLYYYSFQKYIIKSKNFFFLSPYYLPEKGGASVSHTVSHLD